MKKINISLIAAMLLAALFVTSCDLTEVIPDELTDQVVSADTSLLPNLMAPPLGKLRGLWWRQSFWGFQEATSDECFFPTRGTDWFDGGVWQDDYLLNWTPQHRDVVDTWNKLNEAIAATNISLSALGVASPNDASYILKYRAQLKFLRGFYEYCLYDLYRVFPYRDPFDQNFLKQPEIFKGTPGFYHIVTEVKSVLKDMKTREEAKYGEPNRDAALMLLAKMYLNEQVYTGTAGYDSCEIYLDQLINTGHYGLADDYFNMFSVDNDQNYKKPDDEAIFVAVYDDAQDYGLDGSVVWVQPTFHYNQDLGAGFTNWNGCAAPEGYLDKDWIQGTDTATDVRWKDARFYPQMAVYLGFNYGQQYGTDGTALKDRLGNPLNFTFNCSFKQANESMGVRVLKYPPRVKPVKVDRVANDFIIWRYADALLMKAECLVRDQGDVGSALAIVNQIRTKRKAPTITATTTKDMLDKILVERGLELYWEGHRRQDMIRFGTFLQPKTDKDNVSPDSRIILPIPQSAIDGSDGVLTQNPGY